MIVRYIDSSPVVARGGGRWTKEIAGMIGMGLQFATDGNREGMRDEHGEGSDALLQSFALVVA
jgi:hypothetical protein